MSDWCNIIFMDEWTFYLNSQEERNGLKRKDYFEDLSINNKKINYCGVFS